MPSQKSNDAFDRAVDAGRKANSHVPFWAYNQSPALKRYRDHIPDPNAEPEHGYPHASAKDFYSRDDWTKAWSALYSKCRVSHPDEPAKRDACGCGDDSRNIPCDGNVHERTFGPVTPGWPSLDDMKAAELEFAVKKTKATGKMTGLADPYLRAYIFPEGPASYRTWKPGAPLADVPYWMFADVVKHSFEASMMGPVALNDSPQAMGPDVSGASPGLVGTVTKALGRMPTRSPSSNPGFSKVTGSMFSEALNASEDALNKLLRTQIERDGSGTVAAIGK